jgi:hypothetical protein
MTNVTSAYEELADAYHATVDPDGAGLDEAGQWPKDENSSPAESAVVPSPPWRNGPKGRPLRRSFMVEHQDSNLATFFGRPPHWASTSRPVRNIGTKTYGKGVTGPWMASYARAVVRVLAYVFVPMFPRLLGCLGLVSAVRRP